LNENDYEFDTSAFESHTGKNILRLDNRGSLYLFVEKASY